MQRQSPALVTTARERTRDSSQSPVRTSKRKGEWHAQNHMSRAVRSSDHQPSGPPPGVKTMPGASTTPAANRPLDAVLDDHANACWGEIRMVFPLDRERAVRVIVAAFRALLCALKGDVHTLRNELLATRRVAGIAASLAQRLARDGEQQNPICRCCKQSVRDHHKGCPVKNVADACAGLGIDVRSHH